MNANGIHVLYCQRRKSAHGKKTGQIHNKYLLVSWICLINYNDIFNIITPVQNTEDFRSIEPFVHVTKESGETVAEVFFRSSAARVTSSRIPSMSTLNSHDPSCSSFSLVFQGFLRNLSWARFAIQNTEDFRSIEPFVLVTKESGVTVAEVFFRSSAARVTSSRIPSMSTLNSHDPSCSSFSLVFQGFLRNLSWARFAIDELAIKNKNNWMWFHCRCLPDFRHINQQIKHNYSPSKTTLEKQYYIQMSVCMRYTDVWIHCIKNIAYIAFVYNAEIFCINHGNQIGFP